MTRLRTKKTLYVAAALVVVAGTGTALVISHIGSSKTPPAKTSTPAITSFSSPTILIRQITPYFGQTVRTKGAIAKLGNDYYLVGQEKTSPGAIKLDFSKTSINPEKYAKSTVTVIAKVSSNASSPALLVVQSVQL